MTTGYRPMLLNPVLPNGSFSAAVPDYEGRWVKDCDKDIIHDLKNRGLLFHRDLARPHDEPTLRRLVGTYAAEATPLQRRLFAESLKAALTVEEVAQLVADFGFDPDTVRMTSDRHWTWCVATPIRR